VIVAAGVVGTLELLLVCRDRYACLPALSPVLGLHVRTNSESILPITSRDPKNDVSDRSIISSHFFVGESHITQNRFSPSHRVLRWQTGPLVSDPVPWRRALKTLWQFVSHPLDATLCIRAGRQWSARTSLFTGMQTADNQLNFDYGRSAPLESLGNVSTTAHVLGGCVIGGAVGDGVIDERHEVFGYPGLFVVDASAISAHVGVNPSLTITAMAECAMACMPLRDDQQFV
jgi:cholesterol oxidase